MSSFIKKYQSRINNVNFFALLVFIFWLPFKDDFLPIILAFWILTWLLEGNFKNRIKYFPSKLLYYSIVCYFILTVLSLFFSGSISHGLFQVQEKLSMIFFPLFLAGSNQKVKQNFKIILLIFVLGNLIASLYCLGNALLNSFVLKNGQWVFQYYINHTYESFSFFHMVNLRFSYFSYTYLSVFKHPTYFSLYILFSIVILYYLISSGFVILKRIKIIYYILIIFFIIMLYLLQSRAGIISMVIVLILISIIEIHKRLKRKYFITGLVLLLIFSYIIISNTKVSKNISELSENFTNPKGFSLMESDTRYQSWYSAIKVIEENFWFGTGPANLTNELTKKYNTYGFEIAEKEQLNAHNQYIETFAGLGIIGFLSLLCFLGYLLFFAIKKRNYLLFFLFIILSVNFLFESMLNRMAGILFMMFFVSLLIFANIPAFNNIDSGINKK